MPTDIKVKDAMVSRVIIGKPSQTVQEASKAMAKEDVGSLIICEGSKLVGIITRRDIVEKVAAKDLNASEVKVKDIMTKNLVTTSPDEDIEEAARKMSKYGHERLPVVSLGKVVGIISTREIAKVAPAAIEILRERLLMTEPGVAEEFNEGDCELCGNYSDALHNINDRWTCDSCRDEAEEL